MPSLAFPSSLLVFLMDLTAEAAGIGTVGCLALLRFQASQLGSIFVTREFDLP